VIARPPSTPSAGRLAVAVAVAAIVVGGAPVAGMARSRLQQRLGPRFSLVLTAAVVGLAGLGLLRGAVAARPFTSARLAALGGALGVAAAWVAWMGQTDPAIRAVELVHFLEYGLITAAFHRVWRDRDPVTAVALPGLSAGLAGVAEEWWQWFLPARVGEIKDVALNAVAIGCALVVLRAFAPPPAGHAPRAAWAPARRLAAVVVVALAAFVHTVHLGVRVVDGPRAFDSRFTPAELDRAAAARARAWAGAPPLVRPDRLSREDQYATEGLQHVQARNQAWAAGDAATAWHENLVLERFFAPVLDTPSYVSKTGHRWSPGQRAEAAGRAAAGTGAPFVSAAFPYPLWRLPAPAVWASAAIVALALWPWRAGRPGVSP
jgi:hypothetical protein